MHDLSIAAQVARYFHGRRDWWLSWPSGPHNPFLSAGPTGSEPVPHQGWKLHVSADATNWETVLDRVLPVLDRTRVRFKTIGDVRWLADVNQGAAGLSQIGKFATIYPGSDEEARHIAEALHERCVGLRAPSIPSDRAFRSGSIVHYRYGCFDPNLFQTLTGRVAMGLCRPDGVLVEDQRLPRYVAPSWAVDPFQPNGDHHPGDADKSSAGTADPVERAGYHRLHTVVENTRHRVSLGLDVSGLRTCFIKEIACDRIPADVSTISREAQRTEAHVLTLLAHRPELPALFLHKEDDVSAFLVTEDLPHDPLATVVKDYWYAGTPPTVQQQFGWFEQLADVLSCLHAAGWVYVDLKPSNILLSSGGDVFLVDFEGCAPVDGATSDGRLATRGYRAPRLADARVPARPRDDVYSLGAVMLYCLTGVDAAVYPAETAALCLARAVLPGQVGDRAADVVLGCLDPHSPFENMEQLRGTLRGTLRGVARSSAQGVAASTAVRPPPSPEDFARRAMSALATLEDMAVEGTGGEVWWCSTHDRGKGYRGRGVNTGVAGVVLALSQAQIVAPDVRTADLLKRAAMTLAVAPRHAGEPHCGLFVGEAGVAVALIAAGAVLRDESLLRLGLEHSRWIGSQGYTSPDLFGGSAGRLRAHLIAHRASGAPQDLGLAEECANQLLRSVTRENGYLSWPIPPGHEGLSGNAYLGYAHGLAGIADALLDLVEATGHAEVREVAVEAATVLHTRSRPGDTVAWPLLYDGTVAPPLWCHGAVGIGRFFLHALRAEVYEPAEGIARAAARAAGATLHMAGPTKCHGLSGGIDFLLDLSRELADDDLLVQARRLGGLLEQFLAPRPGRRRAGYCSEDPAVVTPDYLVGHAGVTATLFSLADSGRTSGMPLASVDEFARTFLSCTASTVRAPDRSADESPLGGDDSPARGRSAGDRYSPDRI